MAKKLQVWNGRAGSCLGSSGGWSSDKLNICAYSMADARRLIVESGGIDPGAAEIRNYFSNCWGDDMEGVERERGLWLVKRGNKPERIY